MLRLLKIENIAVIESAEIELQNGFNVLTGETGAGKSILIDSINAVLGERTSKELIRTGEKKAYISALFSDISEHVKNKLSALDIETEDSALLLERILSSDGKSISKINGRAVLAQLTREVANFLIDIHGQHDNQQILNSDEHYLFLDKFAENQKEKEEYYQTYKEFCGIKKQLDSSSLSEEEKQAKLELLKFQISELESANIRLNERNELREKRGMMRDSEKLMEALNTADQLFALNDENNIIQMLNIAESALTQVSNYDTILKIYERVQALRMEAEDIRFEIESNAQKVSFDKDEQEKTEERLQMYSSLSRKYGETEQEMLDFLENAKNELDSISLNEEKIESLENQLVEKQYELIDRAKALTESRKNAAKLLGGQIEEQLLFLDIPNIKFIADITENKYTSTGCDRIEFLISTNLGEEPKPLSKIASGGELSRIMLAIKNVFAEKDDIDILIFDEIDTGISGRAANKVGIKLKETAGNHQVLCVTHLAQIASKADSHYLIEKGVLEQRTYTTVTRLSDENRKFEIARIIGGEITQYSLLAAEKMLEN